MSFTRPRGIWRGSACFICDTAVGATSKSSQPSGSTEARRRTRPRIVTLDMGSSSGLFRPIRPRLLRLLPARSGGQFVMVIPAYDLVLVHLARTKRDASGGQLGVSLSQMSHLLTLILAARPDAG